MSKDTHKLMLDHSQAKVRLYGEYLAKYLTIISQDKYTTCIHLYDMFSGEGIYEDKNIGSPIIALQKINNYYGFSNGKMPSIKITFNDIDSKVILKLKEALKKTNNPPICTVKVLNDNYSNLVKEVNKEIGSFQNEKAIIFLDPKGYKEISISDIREYLKNKKTEVLVFLPIRDMHRFANMTREERSAGHEPLYVFIKEVFPNDVPKFESQLHFIQKIKEGLKKVLPEYFIDTFTLEREPGQFFCLFFFTSHIYGFEKMLETKWEIDTTEGRILRYEKTGEMFSGTENLNFPERLKQFIQGERKYNSDVYYFCLQEGFLPTHATQILINWQQGGILDVFYFNGTEARKRSFYLNYEEYSNNPKKVYFSYKNTLF